MTNKIIEKIEFDTKVTDNFYVIKKDDKQVKNSDFIKDIFELITFEEVYYYGYVHLQFENYIYLSFTNQHGFQIDFLINSITSRISQNARNYLSNNYDDEILRTIIEIYDNAISTHPYGLSKNQ